MNPDSRDNPPDTMPEPSSLAIMKENQDHLVQVSSLFKQVFFKDFSPEVFLWKYRMKEYGRIFAVCAWDFDKNELVGHVASIPLAGWKEGREIVFFQFVDAMVHEKARGRNLLTRMIHRLLEEIEHSQDAFIPYVFPGPVSSIIGQKHGWLHVVSEIEDLCPQRATGLSFLRRLPVRFIKDEPEKRTCNRLWDEVGKHFSCLLKRDWEFVNWRYLNNPVERYDFFYVEIFGRLRGWFVTGIYPDGRRLVDYLVPPGWIKPFFLKICDAFGDVKCWIPHCLRQYVRGISFAGTATPLTLAAITTASPFDLVSLLKKSLFFTMADIDIY
ncbi:GNAT family N-acetyltransferase [Thermodesulforhabdus norvegica]|uniref:Acetyltransferase (GNAT) domain-containing protein n=1 Tax=Thermodesulforhabdus norvegica TaxID=39841 RepID=A0A1I4UZI7_9BACT|nr:GNAT family N-acetyltransferase [Thermodesulforhabdus norvegica]SFM94409.1 Acetyltransferase (GNAT) domain-containing protein [Thermodesulforhabdus norvegica]